MLPPDPCAIASRCGDAVGGQRWSRRRRPDVEQRPRADRGARRRRAAATFERAQQIDVRASHRDTALLATTARTSLAAVRARSITTMGRSRDRVFEVDRSATGNAATRRARDDVQEAASCSPRRAEPVVGVVDAARRARRRSGALAGATNARAGRGLRSSLRRRAWPTRILVLGRRTADGNEAPRSGRVQVTRRSMAGVTRRPVRESNGSDRVFALLDRRAFRCPNRGPRRISLHREFSEYFDRAR